MFFHVIDQFDVSFKHVKTTECLIKNALFLNKMNIDRSNFTRHLYTLSDVINLITLYDKLSAYTEEKMLFQVLLAWKI